MSLPMAAAGPLKVVTKPILMDFCWAVAGPATSSKAALAAINALRMVSSPRGRSGPLFSVP